jgi:hypothetical protein
VYCNSWLELSRIIQSASVKDRCTGSRLRVREQARSASWAEGTDNRLTRAAALYMLFGVSCNFKLMRRDAYEWNPAAS